MSLKLPDVSGAKQESEKLVLGASGSLDDLLADSDGIFLFPKYTTC